MKLKAQMRADGREVDIDMVDHGKVIDARGVEVYRSVFTFGATTVVSDFEAALAEEMRSGKGAGMARLADDYAELEAAGIARETIEHA